MNNFLTELLVPFPKDYIKQKPGKGGDYVIHGVVRQRLLDVVGFYDWCIDREIYNGDKLTGCIGTLTIYVGEEAISVQGAGDVEHDQGTNGANLKHAESDAFKRAAMNLGLGLHLWCGDEYFVYNKNKSKAEGGPSSETAGSESL